MAHLSKLSEVGNFLKCYRLENRIKKLSVHRQEIFPLAEVVSWLA